MRKKYAFIIMGILLMVGISLWAYVFSLSAKVSKSDPQIPSSDLKEASVNLPEKKAAISTELALDSPQPCLTTTAPK